MMATYSLLILSFLLGKQYTVTALLTYPLFQFLSTTYVVRIRAQEMHADTTYDVR
jgi:hypothetical protein